MKTLLVSLLLAAAVSLIGCAQSSSSKTPDSASPSNTPTPTNSTGFPVIQGRYAFNTKALSFTCSDGSSGTGGTFALNFDITQADNSFTVIAAAGSGGTIPGMTIIESSVMKGNVKKDSSFLAQNIIKASIDGIAGTETITYNLDGSFTSTGWSGNYTYTVLFLAYSTSCTYKTTFDGDKVTSSISGTASRKLDAQSGWFQENYVTQAGELIGSAF